MGKLYPLFLISLHSAETTSLLVLVLWLLRSNEFPLGVLMTVLSVDDAQISVEVLVLSVASYFLSTIDLVELNFNNMLAICAKTSDQ